MKKNLTFTVVLFCLIFAMAFPAGAASQVIQETETITAMYGDIEVETTTVVYSYLRSNTKSADKTSTYKQSGKVIAEITLSATFGYDGKTAWVVSASGSHNTYNGWGYSGQNITQSGGTATLTANITKFAEHTVPASVSLTCTASGGIS